MTSSVLISVYRDDSPCFLRSALESIYSLQTKKPNEIVIVEDGPISDDLRKIIDEFAKSVECRVKILAFKENKGLGEALRIGAKKCTGDVIFRMDSDDISDRLRFEKQLDYLEKNPQIDVVGSDIGEFEIDPKLILRTRVCPTKHKDIVRMSKTRNPMNHVSVAIRRESLEKIGGYKPLALIEDYYLWVRMIANGCVLANVNESLVYVRIGNGFGKRRSSKVRIKSWKTLQKYMVCKKMVSKLCAFRNMCYIRLFVYAPTEVRNLLYKRFLRK